MGESRLPKAVLWDMDGTLIDSEPYWIASETALAKDYGHSWTEENAHEMIGKSLYDSSAMLKTRFSIDDLTVQGVIDRLTNEVVENLKQELHWRPGALELLIALKKAGIKTALVTMSMRRMALAVVNQIPFEAFDVVVAGDDVIHGKPHPEPYLTAAALLGVEPSECVAFEDSRTGLESAVAAGTIAVGVPNIVELKPGPGRIIIRSLTDVSLESLQEMSNF
jgi:HAD superfamily hydrolase (TIGR01509 family)